MEKNISSHRHAIWYVCVYVCVHVCVFVCLCEDCLKKCICGVYVCVSEYELHCKFVYLCRLWKIKIHLWCVHVGDLCIWVWATLYLCVPMCRLWKIKMHLWCVCMCTECVHVWVCAYVRHEISPRISGFPQKSPKVIYCGRGGQRPFHTPTPHSVAMSLPRHSS